MIVKLEQLLKKVKDSKSNQFSVTSDSIEAGNAKKRKGTITAKVVRLPRS